MAQNISEQIDGIIILGGAESPRKTLRWNQPQLNDASERLIAAASLAIAHPEARIVYAGGSGRLLDTVAARVVRHARATTFQLAEVAVTGLMVRAILAAIRRLRAPPRCA